ncbi:hypothetical protein DFAR_3060033 [Desulfarculales bacterium]
MEEEKNWGQKLMAEDAKENPPGINLRFLAQGMIKIAHEDLPAGFFDWSLEDQLGWAYEYWSHMDDDQLVKGVAYLTPIEDAVIDMVEVDGWYKDEEYPVLASTKTWTSFWAGGRDEKLRPPEEVTKLENLTNAAPKLLAACKLALEAYQWLAEKHGIECDAIPLEDALAAAEGREEYH